MSVKARISIKSTWVNGVCITASHWDLAHCLVALFSCTVTCTNKSQINTQYWNTLITITNSKSKFSLHRAKFKFDSFSLNFLKMFQSFWDFSFSLLLIYWGEFPNQWTINVVINKKAFQWDAYSPLVDRGVGGLCLGCVSREGVCVFRGVCLGGGVCMFRVCVCVQGVCLGGMHTLPGPSGPPPRPRGTPPTRTQRQTPTDPEAYTLSWTDKHLWKHYLAPNFVCGW